MARRVVYLDLNPDLLLTLLVQAFFKARSGKKRSPDEHQFELYWMDNLIQLRDDIWNRQYEPGRGIAFQVDKPVIREIFAAPFRDRVVHHLLYDICAPWWEKRFIRDSYSCRKKKGTLDGVMRLGHHIRSASLNGQRKVMVIKLDIQSYFVSMKRSKLLETVNGGLKRQFRGHVDWYDLMSFLWGQIINDDPVFKVRRRGSQRKWDRLPKSKSLFYQAPGYGIVIGNLTSQLLSNIFLNRLDQFIKRELKYKHYGRYVDDFYIVVTLEEYPQALKDVARIEKFLREEMELTLHPKKRHFQEASKGTEFLGVVTYPFCRVPGSRYRRNFYQAVLEVINGIRDPDTVQSYIGHGKYLNSGKAIKKIFKKVGW